MKFKCLKSGCGELFEDLGELEIHTYEVHGEDEVPLYDLVETEEKLSETIQETPEEIPDETDSETISEEDLITIGQSKKALEMYSELNETEKAQVLSRILGILRGKSHDKKFEELVKTENFDREVLARINVSIRNGQCPFCMESYTQQSFYEDVELPEELSKLILGSEEWLRGMLPSPEMIAKSVPLPKLTIYHVRSKHEKLYQILKPLWKGVIPESEIAETPNPENLELETLSEEELLEKAIKSEDFRKALYEKWLKEKQKRN